MHRIDSNGATVDNKFTEGNAGLSIPATVVSAAIMNDMQEELCNFIESVGITLVKGTQTQILSAFQEFNKRGGLSSPVIFPIPNNQTSSVDVTGFPVFLSTAVIAVEFLYAITRRTGSSSVREAGRAYLYWNAETLAWEVSMPGNLDDSGVDFSVVTTGNSNEFKLQLTSDNLTGTSYAGTLRITDIKTVRVA